MTQTAEKTNGKFKTTVSVVILSDKPLTGEQLERIREDSNIKTRDLFGDLRFGEVRVYDPEDAGFVEFNAFGPYGSPEISPGPLIL